MTIETEILNAYDAIHSLSVIHGDVRAENILVGKDAKSVWLIDFEDAEILEKDGEFRISQENESVGYLLSMLRRGHRNGCAPTP